MARHTKRRTDAGTRDCRARGRVWIEGPDDTFPGYGRVVLLQRIREHGPVSAAARSLDMSCRRAWQLLDSMHPQSLPAWRAPGS